MKNLFDKSTISKRILVVTLFLIVLLVAGFVISCRSLEPTPPAIIPGLPKEPTPVTQPTTSAIIEVAIEGFAFKPAEIYIAVGSSVTWDNKDSVIHTVTARDKTFDSGSLSGGEKFSYTFEERGTFEYYCIPHPYMVGKVVVE
jgi:plastocyanin